MKKLLKSSFIFAFIATSFVFTSCSDETTDDLGGILDGIDDGITDDGTTDDTTYDLTVTPTNASMTSERNLEIEATPNSTVTVNVNFTSDEKMYRMYVTKYTYGDADIETYEFGSAFDTKADGSLDLTSEEKASFVYSLEFDTPTAVDETVQYSLWATTGRGDFRDVSKRNAISDTTYGTIVIKGSASASTTASNEIREFSAIFIPNSEDSSELQAPLAQGYSKTFVSVFDGVTYKIVQQSTTSTSVVDGTFTDAEKEVNAEYAAYWDFGYFNTTSLGASFASASYYMDAFTVSGSPVVDITNFTGLTSTDLNMCYFSLSTLSTADFDAATYDTLDAITSPTTQYINNLKADDVVYFEDAYGNKGLIKINNIEGTYNEGDYIEFDVKVQVNYEPIKL